MLTKMTPRDLAESLYARLKAAPPITRRPVATYRLQLHAGFTFDDAERIVEYLQRLGISHAYTSPCFRAAPGSTHGYDVYDHTEANPELGDPATFTDALEAHGMGLLLDFVPNHMGVGSGNRYWMDVLENGPSSEFAHFFDIDWRPVKHELDSKVLVPILGDQYGRVLERGELKLVFGAGAFTVHYYEHVMPVRPKTYPIILSNRIDTLDPADPHVMELQSVIDSLHRMPSPTETDPQRIAERTREREVARRRLQSLTGDAPHLKGFIDQNVRIFNEQPDELDRLLSAQIYRLAHWRVAGEEINYRRFFDINSLAAIRSEDPRVFAHIHGLAFRWLDEGVLTGLRIDHPDGLFNPPEYFGRLQEEQVVRAARGLHDEGDVPWEEIDPLLRELHREDDAKGSLARPLYIVAEKILAYGEEMPRAWPIDGTTGYGFMNALNGVFVDRSHRGAIDELYHRFTGRKKPLDRLLYLKKQLILKEAMASEINMLSHRLDRIAEMNRRTRDFTLNSLRRALEEYIACLAVYRTYVDGTQADAHDTRYIEKALSEALRNATILDASIFEFLRDVLLLRHAPDVSAEEREARRVFTMKLQQLTGAIMAKSAEDTAFYLYNRLVSLNEVGGEPQLFGNTLAEFHSRNLDRRRTWEGGLSATSTHDTKRGEDVRARINVLSELADAWKYHLFLWNRIHMPLKREVRGRLAPDRNEEILLYQTLIGTWPRGGAIDDGYRERIQAHMRKALREGKLHSSWLSPDQAYESAVMGFVESVLAGNEAFVADFVPFMQRIAACGLHNSLSQVVLKIASPGVPDIYQGCELWDDSLVDPDNRRPVDYALRSRLLEEIDARLEADGAARMSRALYRSLADVNEDGRLKLFTTAVALRFRRDHADLFAQGAYVPIDASGRLRHSVCAFARVHEDQAAIAVAPRLVSGLLDEQGLLPAETWKGTYLPIPVAVTRGDLVNVFTGEQVPFDEIEGRPGLRLERLFGGFPVALLRISRGSRPSP